GGKSPAAQDVWSDAELLDGKADDKGGVELVVFAVGGVDAIASLKTDVLGEEVFREHAPAEGVVFATAIKDDARAENAEGEAWREAVSAAWWRHGLDGLAAFFAIHWDGRRAGDQRNGDKHGSECFHGMLVLMDALTCLVGLG